MFPQKKISIYQVLPRLFHNPNSNRVPNGSYVTNGCGKLSSFDAQALRSIKELGCTHIWYTGVIEHATQTSFPEHNISSDHGTIVKGIAGSPYSIRDYYDIAPSLCCNPSNRMAEFEALVQRTHDAGLKVIIDFVPNHVARQYRSDAKPIYAEDFGEHDDRNLFFSPQNNFYYLPQETLHLEYDAIGVHTPYTEFPARVTGNNCFSATPNRNDWYDTVKLNYGVDFYNGQETHFLPMPDTWQKMIDIVLFWVSKGVDGFRCDMAEMVPVEFFKELISKAKQANPELLFIAEIYKPELYTSYLEAGFDLLYDKVGLYDALIRIIKGERPASDITHVWQQTEHLQGKLLHFMENHDEQRLASSFVCDNPIKAFPAMAVSALIDSGAIMTYFGQELGERGMDAEGFSGTDGRTSIFDYWSLDVLNRWIGKNKDFAGSELTAEERQLREKYQRLLNIATLSPVFCQGGFFDLMYVNQHVNTTKEYYFLRANGDEVALVGVNFSSQPLRQEINLPEHAFSTLGIKDESVCKVKNITTNKCGVALLSSRTPYSLEVEPFDIAVYQFCLLNE